VHVFLFFGNIVNEIGFAQKCLCYTRHWNAYQWRCM